MDTMSAYLMGQATRGQPRMVFDWDKAARIIKERRATDATAGLDGDWGYTADRILENGIPTAEDDCWCFLASTWATPQLGIGGEFIDCFVMEDEANGWGADTLWPESAREILGVSE